MTRSTESRSKESRSARAGSAQADATEIHMPKRLRSLTHTFRLGYRAEPRLLLISLGLALLMMLPEALLAVWLKLLVDGVARSSRRDVLVGCLAVAASVTLTWYLSVLSQRVQRRFRDRIAITMESRVAELQATVATIEHHERSDYLDRLAMLRDQVFTLDHMFMSLFSTLGWILRLVVVAVLLSTIHPGLILLLLTAIPALVVSTWRPGVENATWERSVAGRRLARHLFTLSVDASSSKELRVTGTETWLIEARRAAWHRWHQPMRRTRMRSAAWSGAAWAVFAIGYLSAVIVVAERWRRGPGDVVLVLAAGRQLAGYVGATAGELGYLRGFWLDASQRLTWLEDYAASRRVTASAAVPNRLVDGIRFEQLSFTYPGTDRTVLDAVDLHLPAGAVVAVVGENGAGKSTLVKLLARMYAPNSGRITVDGVDLAAIDIDAWRRTLGGAFQDFFRFEFSAQRSVGLGDLDRLDDSAAATTAVERAGAGDVIDRLAAGLDSQLGPTWDGGAELSFGQWQKLALARGLMRDEPLVVILDEPTAALDAQTEHDLFERFAAAARAEASRGRITVIVSHRFSTVRMADLIVVLDGSRVVEVGSHEQLIARAGQYAELYRIQAAGYAR